MVLTQLVDELDIRAADDDDALVDDPLADVVGGDDDLEELVLPDELVDDEE